MEALYPEAVGHRRAEGVKELATAELLHLVPRDAPTESHPALVEVRRVLPGRPTQRRAERRGTVERW